MALIHRAKLQPKKLELMSAWLPEQSWYAGGGELEPIGAYRFDDPAGEVGLDTHLLLADGTQVLQIPMTYRAAPLAGAEAWLIGTAEHTVLGTRWVYDACGDPVYANVLATAILAGGSQAEEQVESNGQLEARTPTARVTGSGDSSRELATVDAVADLSASTDGTVTAIRTPGWELQVNRVLDLAAAPGDNTLTGTWKDQPTPVVLATGQLLSH